MSIKIPTPKYSSYRERRFECDSHHQTRKWTWDDIYEIPCATCSEPASRLLVSAVRFAQGIPPTTYAVNPITGHIWVPGRADKKPPQGYESREIRTWRDRDRFYKQAREKSNREHDEFAVGHELEFGSLVSDGESTLRRYLNEDHIPEIDRETNQPTGRMVRLTPEGRGLIRYALEQSGYEKPKWDGAEASIDSWENENTFYNDRETGFANRRA